MERFDAAEELERVRREKELRENRNSLTMMGAVSGDAVKAESNKRKLPPAGHEKSKNVRQEVMEQLDEELSPTMVIGGFPVRAGNYRENGAFKVPGGVCFTVASHVSSKVTLCLFHRHDAGKPFAMLPFPRSFQVGYTYSMIVFGLDIEEFEYSYRIDGPYDPERGLYFDKDRDLLDPYARAVVGQSEWGKSHGALRPYHARVVREGYPWGKTHFPDIAMEDSIIYELHVRAFTMDASSGVRYPGTFAGIIEKIPYLKSLGVTAVELMPVMEFDETLNSRMIDGKKLYESWGYNTVAFFAPNTSYTASCEFNYEGNELKNLIRLLHENEIEVIMDVVFNHTAEGNEDGPIISFKGYSNNIFYMMTRDGHYCNYSGCGNTVNCNHPVVQDFILDCLRYWVREYHIDGFRFDLASILGRDKEGRPMDNPPLLERLAEDAVIGKTKLIAEAWDAGGLYQVGRFPAFNRWAEWNGQYRDCIREYLKGNYWNAPDTAKRITGSLDFYANGYRGYASSVNFLTCHDGFTLHDLYSYNSKHNEANGWNNTDGSDDNHSWNCGIEGETEDRGVLELRERMMRNAIAVLMTSRGTPMILAGDEFENSQSGNNNCYCQDNEMSWLNWNELDRHSDYFEFYRSMIAFRKAHPVISHDYRMTSIGLPPVLVCSGNPDDPTVDSNTSTLCVLFSGRKDRDTMDDAVYLVINSYWDYRGFRLPWLPSGLGWDLKVDTSREPYFGDFGTVRENGKECYAAPRSVQIFVLRNR